MNKLIITSFAAIISLAKPVLGAEAVVDGAQLTDAENKIAQSISIQESGQIDESVKGKHIAIQFLDGRKRGVESTIFLQKYLRSKGINANGVGYIQKAFKVLAYTHIYSDDKSYNSGRLMINDVLPDKLTMSTIHVSESLIKAHERQDLLKTDMGMIHEGTKLSQTMGSSAGVWGGVIANLAVNLTKFAFSGPQPSAVPLDKGVTSVSAGDCGESCKVTHHVVIFTVLYDEDPKHYYSLALDRVDDKINESNLTVLANQGLQTVAEKIAQAVVSN